MYKIILECFDVSPDVGLKAAADIEQEFREHRSWHSDPSCRFADGKIMLTAKNDYDREGLALLDEFGDCLAAYIGEHGPVHVRSVEME